MSTIPIVVLFVGAMGAFGLWVWFLVQDSVVREARGPHEVCQRAESLPAPAWVSPAPARLGWSDRRPVQQLAVAAIAALLFISVYLGGTRGSLRHPT